MTTLIIVLISCIVFVVITLFYMTAVVVNEQTAAILQRLGRFSKILHPGLNFKLPFIEEIAGTVSLRITQLDVKVETKTEDNVFVHVTVAVQYFVFQEHVYEAFYKLKNPEQQITSFVFDVVRARVPRLKLDELFEKKDEIAIAVKDEITSVMKDFGYGILKSLVTDIEPDQKVKISMNEINAAQRLRIAAVEKGEAERIITVKAAEAAAQSNALHGQGIAQQREAIIEGLSKSVSEFREHIPGTSAQDVMFLVLMTQYFDTLKDISANAQTNTILLPHSPSTLTDLSEQMRNAMLVAGQVQNATKK
ncbi:TPA: SPFH domain-containing protein [Candidatus Dependentiae bacterium]|nr:MAG: Band 7 protein [candidate division TM6 bacterium GW2011_GWF2_43_87]HBL98285.1 SPFH domain-containing protein [Candidatus Dependentiae bacterium]